MNILKKLSRSSIIKPNSAGICSSAKRNASIEIREDNPQGTIFHNIDPFFNIIKLIHYFSRVEILSSRSDSKEQRLYVWGLAELGALGEIKIRSQRAKGRLVHRPIRKIFAFSHRVSIVYS